MLCFEVFLGEESRRSSRNRARVRLMFPPDGAAAAAAAVAVAACKVLLPERRCGSAKHAAAQTLPLSSSLSPHHLCNL